MTSTHNLIFETAGREVSAHEHMLLLASPMLNAMLQSIMKEGSSKRIQVRDSSESGVSLFLDSGPTGHFFVLKLSRRWIL